MTKFNFLRHFAKRLSIPTASVTPTKTTKKRSRGEEVSSHGISRFSKSSSSSSRKKPITTDNVSTRPSPTSSTSKVSKKSWWMKKLCMKKRSHQNIRSQLEEITSHQWTETVEPVFVVSSSDSNLDKQMMCPEYTATGSVHSYISSSDDECVGRTIVLPVLSVTQSVADIHNTCILEWVPDHCTENEESQESANT